jgi:hypothetical protein
MSFIDWGVSTRAPQDVWNNVRPTTMREAYFHEDDYCQIEVLPLDDLYFCLRQAGEIAEFSNEHRAGSSWDAMYIRGANPTPLASLNISLSQVREALP